MKRIKSLSLALIIGVCLQPLSLFAQDQGPANGDTKDTKDLKHADKAAPHADKDALKGPDQDKASEVDKSSAKISDRSTGEALRSKDTPALSNKPVSQGVQQTSQRQSSPQGPALVVQGNQANHYDGRWSAASSHSNWDQNTDHRWNNHDYRWYDGGWLIIDIGPGPGDIGPGSVGSNVQESLAQRGYYDGPIDGEIGRGTRRAISHYESDNGLPINGQIDEPLLVSLRLE
jgi:hypothetical protein